ncbi:hypothetical protein LEP1GSC202_3658 [Leptospira yanagawae serovar Saopaulo str. Sao Paulo = ATCC 700523]|uniref:Restriction endonuclease n=1 Tax=Leptospira yanagawae serovar Saopaulo str. Sao Paulo = ATCC 700523 TaxID=1249483 RepID=A0A5E8H9A0_9LEPT|nr:hypothetical protein [Leptospira yanagawae]EOQ87220.1 hypothetical protein LEP1GSC202_3658 [Leptospira yanagawae serovar Saopaulo str. Sao Paulo = ATCC 700523]
MINDLIKSNPELINKSLTALLGLCGDGKLKNGNNCSIEFRQFLTNIPILKIKSFIQECIESNFTDSGYVLQDLINEIGRRLGFLVEFGLYQGNKNEIGNDGLWIDQNNSFVIEVKTTDAYRISTDKIDNYRTKLIEKGKINAENSYNLIVVGRQDTGDLEAQIRGSIHAWRTRIISVDSLWKLLSTKEKLDDPQVIKLITQCLQPFEYTKLDRLIDLVFSTSQDLTNNASELLEPELSVDEENSEKNEKKFTPLSFHQEVVFKLEELSKNKYNKVSKSLFESEDKNNGELVIVSKEYKTKNNRIFWYAFHPHQEKSLEKYKNSNVVLACGSNNLIYRIPFNIFKPLLQNMNTTETEDRKYWHVKISINTELKAFILQPLSGQNVDISNYLMK